jgi:hypothetical protein
VHIRLLEAFKRLNVSMIILKHLPHFIGDFSRKWMVFALVIIKTGNDVVVIRQYIPFDDGRVNLLSSINSILDSRKFFEKESRLNAAKAHEFP